MFTDPNSPFYAAIAIGKRMNCLELSMQNSGLDKRAVRGAIEILHHVIHKFWHMRCWWRYKIRVNGRPL